MCRSREPQFSRPALLTAAAIFAFAIPCLATANYENSNVFRLDRPTSQVYSSMGSLISTEGPLTSDGSSLSFDNHAIGLTQRYDKGRVFLSFFVSLFGSVATLELLLFRMRSTGWSSSFHLLAAGCAFGGGTTWAMHFISNNALFLDFKLNAVDFPIPLDEELAKRFKDNVSLSFEDAQALLVARGNHSLPLTFEGKYTALSLLMTVALMMIAFALMGFQSPLEIFLWIHPYLSRRMELKRTKDSTAEPTGLESFPSTPGSEIDHAGLIGPPRQRTNSSVSTLVATNDHHETPVPDASMQKWQWIRRLSMFSTATSCRRQDTSRDLVESTTKEQDGILALQKQETRVERIEACPPVGGAIPKPSGTELVGCMHKAEPQTAPRRKKVEILDSQENDLVIAEPEADGDRTFADSSVDEIWYSRASGWDRGRTMRLVFAGALAGGAVSGMHYVGNLSVLFIRFRYRARFVILSTFISTFIVVTVFFVLFDLLKPKLLHRLWTRILLAFLLSGGGCLMHYSATLGTQYYITSRQMAAILLEPGFWRAGRIPRMLTIEVAASATVALSCLLALIAWVSHRRAERRKTTVKQHVILALFLFDVKTLKLLVNEDGMVPHVDVGPLVIPPGETGSPFMSPKLPPALSPPQVAKGLKLKLWSRVLHPFGLGVEKEEAEPEVTKLYEGHPLFARAIRTTWAWQQPRGQRGSVCYSSATTETCVWPTPHQSRKGSKDSLHPWSASVASVPEACKAESVQGHRASVSTNFIKPLPMLRNHSAPPKVPDLEPLGLGLFASADLKRSRSSKVLFPGTSTRRQSCPERMSTDGDDKILKDLEAFVIGGPLPKSRKSSIAADKPAAEAYHRDLKRSYFGGSLFPSRTRRQPSDEECKFELGSKLGLSRAEQLFEVSFDKAASNLMSQVWPSNPSTGKSTLGVLYDKIVRLGGELGERELLILARPIISSTEAFQLTRRNHVFLDAITAGRKINQHLGTEVGPRLVGEVQSFVQTGMTLAGQLRKGWLYCGLLVIQSHLYDGLHVAVEPQSRHSLPMIELGTLERPDGAQPSTSLGTLEELNEAVSGLEGQTLMDLVLATGEVLGDQGWNPSLIPKKSQRFSSGDDLDSIQMRPDFVRSKKGAGRLAGLLVQNLVTYLDTTQPAEVVSHLLSRLVIVPQIVPLLEESTSSTYPELQNAYTIVFKAALSPDVEFSSLCWSPWNVFSAQNECVTQNAYTFATGSARRRSSTPEVFLKPSLSRPLSTVSTDSGKSMYVAGRVRERRKSLAASFGSWSSIAASLNAEDAELVGNTAINARRGSTGSSNLASNHDFAPSAFGDGSPGSNLTIEAPATCNPRRHFQTDSHSRKRRSAATIGFLSPIPSHYDEDILGNEGMSSSPEPSALWSNFPSSENRPQFREPFRMSEMSRETSQATAESSSANFVSAGQVSPNLEVLISPHDLVGPSSVSVPLESNSSAPPPSSPRRKKEADPSPRSKGWARRDSACSTGRIRSNSTCVGGDVVVPSERLDVTNSLAFVRSISSPPLPESPSLLTNQSPDVLPVICGPHGGMRPSSKKSSRIDCSFSNRANSSSPSSSNLRVCSPRTSYWTTSDSNPFGHRMTDSHPHPDDQGFRYPSTSGLGGGESLSPCSTRNVARGYSPGWIAAILREPMLPSPDMKLPARGRDTIEDIDWRLLED